VSRPAAFHWGPASEPAEFAYSGVRVIGFISPVRGGPAWRWEINDVMGSKYEPATRGQSGTQALAKRALRRAWLRWLADRGLTEVKT
jgi:hypothetical protein